MLIAPFQMQSKAYLVDNSAAVQVVTSSGGSSQYRIRNKGAAEAFISWSRDPSAINTTQATVGTPQTGIIGMGAGVTETFTLPAQCWFQASAAATFEVIAGEGT